MKKIKLTFGIVAVLTGFTGAFAFNPPSSSSPALVHDWINWDNELVLVNQTQAQAQLFCAGTFGICLRAKDNVFIFTTGVPLY